MFHKGLNQDVVPEMQEKGTYRYALNFNLNNTNLQKEGSGTSGLGNFNVALLPDGYIDYGFLKLNDNSIIIFSTNGTNSEIGKLQNDTYTTLINNTFFNFQTWIQAEYKINNCNEYELYWVDGINPPRYLNLSKLSNVTNENSKIFLELEKFPKLDLINVNYNGGELYDGVYQIAISYGLDDKSFTNWFLLSNNIYINDETTNGKTNRSFTFSVCNIDLNYTLLRYAIIYNNNETKIFTKKIADFCTNDCLTITHSGQDTNYEIGSIKQIVVDLAHYTNAQTIHQMNGVLYMGNLNKYTEFDFQPYVNNIQLEVVNNISLLTLANNKNINVVDNLTGYNDALISYNFKTYKRNEVYAFYIAFILKDGSRTSAYHIVGREAESIDVSDITTGTIYDKFGLQKNYLFNSNPNTNNVGYWENENEQYPNTDSWDIKDCNGNITGTLKCNNVRHHKMPNNINNSYISNDNQDWFPIGIKLKNICIPTEMKDKILGYEIFYAEKTEDNRLILDQTSNLLGRLNPSYEPESSLLNYFDTESKYITHGYHPKFEMDFASTTSPSKQFSLSPSTLYLHPFEIYRKNLNIKNVDYITTSLHYNYTGKYDKPYELPMDNLGIHSLHPISGKAKVQKGYSTLQHLHFPLNFDNTYGEDKIVVELDALIGTPSFGNNLIQDKYQCDICQFKKNVHISFNNQTLISTGYIHTDLDDTETEVFYGGDIYLTPYWYYAVSLWNPFWNDLILGNKPEFALFFKDLFQKLFFQNNNLIDTTEFNQVKDKILPDGELHFEFVESRDNINWRKNGELINQLFATADNAQFESSYPKYTFPDVTRPIFKSNILSTNPSATLLYFQEWLDFYTLNNNNIFYNDFHSSHNKLKPVFTKQFDNCEIYKDRIIRSTNNIYTNEKHSWRNYYAENYYDLINSNDEIVNLSSWNNKLIIHTDKTLYLTKGNEQLVIDDSHAYIGNNDIFATTPMSSDINLGILNKRNALKTQWGYVFYSLTNNKFYILNDKFLKLNDMDSYFYNTSSLSNNLHLSEDIQFDKIYLTVKDRFTLSYLPNKNIFESFWSFKPRSYANNNLNLYSIKDGKIYKHNVNNNTTYYEVKQPTIVRFIETAQNLQSKQIISAYIISRIFDNQVEIYEDSIDFIQIFSYLQSTNVIQLNDTNTRRISNVWHFNEIRDNVSDQRLADRFFNVELRYDNKHFLELLDAGLIFKQDKR